MNYSDVKIIVKFANRLNRRSWERIQQLFESYLEVRMVLKDLMNEVGVPTKSHKDCYLANVAFVRVDVDAAPEVAPF